jgi:diguanylate cyclase (GGDEF)-like protein
MSAIDSVHIQEWHWITAITSFGFVLVFIVLQDHVLELARRSHVNWMNATRDRLTGLLNRHGFELAIEEEMSKDDPQFALFLIDLDKFKLVNDTYLHSVGDEVLKICGKRIANATKKGDAIARFGGDEFIALLPGISRADALLKCDRIRQNIEAPIVVDGIQISVGASCGICLYAPGYSVSELIAFADVRCIRQSCDRLMAIAV